MLDTTATIQGQEIRHVTGRAVSGNMKHDFTYKLIGRVDQDLLQELKEMVVRGSFKGSKDFQRYTVTGRWDIYEEPAYKKFIGQCMTRFFQQDGHIETNVAKMVPGGYVPEHSDYQAWKHGSNQALIAKLQVPIITNSGCGLMWRWDRTGETADTEVAKAEAAFLEEGGIYLFDNVRVHSSVNLGSTDRYWLTTRWKAESVLDQTIL